MKTFLQKNKYLIVISIIAIILGGLFLHQCRKNDIAEKKLEVANHNIAALNDTLRITQTNSGKPEFDKLAFLTDKVENLIKLNKDLAREVKETKGKVASIVKGSISIQRDSFPVLVKAELVDSTVTAKFDHDTTYSPGNYRTLAGFTQYNLRNGQSNGIITKDKIGMTFVTGIKNLDKGKPEIFLRSDFPGFVVDSVSGAVLDPALFKPKTKQKLLTFGLNIGYTPITYSVAKKKLDFDATRFGASIGINANISRLFGK